MQTKHFLTASLMILATANLMAQTNKDIIVKTEDAKFGYYEATARSISPVATAHTTPVAADLAVSNQRITHKESIQNTISAEDLKDPDNSALIRYIKDFTLTRAAKKYNADVILVPTFDIRTSDDGKRIDIEITGYPASYTNFRKATNADFELIRAGFNTSSSTPQPTEKQTTIINPAQK